MKTYNQLYDEWDLYGDLGFIWTIILWSAILFAIFELIT